MTARVLKAFTCRLQGRVYYEGDEYDGTPERLRELSEGGYVQKRLITHSDQENGSDEVADDSKAISADMTVTQLREIADSRGIDVPKRAKKAELLEILGD